MHGETMKLYRVYKYTIWAICGDFSVKPDGTFRTFKQSYSIWHCI